MMFYEMIDSTTSQFDYTDYCEVIMILCTQEVVVCIVCCHCVAVLLCVGDLVIEQIRPRGSHN